VYKKWKKTSNRILFSLLIVNILSFISYLLFHLKIIPRIRYQYLYLIGDFLFLLLGTLIFFYTKSLCFSDFKFTKKERVHFLPFLLLSCAVVLYFFYDKLTHNGFLQTQTRVLSVSESIVFYAVLHVFILSYVLGTIRVLTRYRKEIKKYYSSINRIDLTWLLLLFFTFVFMWILEVGLVIQSFVPGSEKFLTVLITSVSVMINIVFVVIIVLKGLVQVDVFNGIPEKPKNPPTTKLSQEQLDSYTEQFKKHIQENKSYLEPLLTLNEVAGQLSLPPRHLSQAINRSLHKNFFDVISDYRIDEAKRMLKDPANAKKSILQICYDAGFNSKSSFNSLFKKKTGLTPSQFRKM